MEMSKNESSSSRFGCDFWPERRTSRYSIRQVVKIRLQTLPGSWSSRDWLIWAGAAATLLQRVNFLHQKKIFSTLGLAM